MAYYVHADWRNKNGKAYVTYHKVMRDRITAEDHVHAFNALVKAFPDSWDTGWQLLCLAVFPHKP